MISVVINCLNCQELVKRAIDSVYQQTYSDWEIVFIDNASNDSSGSIAMSYGDKVRYYRLDQTVSLGEARGLGVVKSTGDVVAFLDSDDEWHNEKLDLQLKMMYKDEVDFVFTNTLITEGGVRSYNLLDYGGVKNSDVFNSLLENDFISTSSVLFKKSVYCVLEDGYDSALTIECDRDLFLRMSYASSVGYIEEPLTVRYLHDASTTRSRREASTGELLHLVDKIDKFCANTDRCSETALKAFKSRCYNLIGRNMWCDGNHLKARGYFSMSSDARGGVLWFMTFLYPFRVDLKFISFVFRYLKYFGTFIRRIKR